MSKPKRLYTEDELKKLFSAVAHEIINAHVHYKLFRDLRKSIRGYKRELNQSPTFWSLTMNANIRAAISSLCLVYDTDPKVLSIGRLIEKLRDSDNQPWKSPDERFDTPPFGTSRKLPTAARMKRDIKAASWDDPLTKKLLWQRCNIYAHKNEKNVMNGGVDQARFTLSHRQFSRLLERALKTLNYYDTIYRGHSWSKNMVGNDDYRFVLKTVRDWLKNDDAEHKAQIAEFKRQDRERKKKKERPPESPDDRSKE